MLKRELSQNTEPTMQTTGRSRLRKFIKKNVRQQKHSVGYKESGVEVLCDPGQEGDVRRTNKGRSAWQG